MDTVNPYQLTIDNLDRTVNPYILSSSHQPKDFHWLIMVANQERVSGTHLSEESATPAINVPIREIIPNKKDRDHLRDEFKELVGRGLVSHIEELNVFHDNVQFHLPHQYSAEMAMQTETVPLGLLDTDERKTSELSQALKHIHDRYVPLEKISTGESQVVKPAVKMILTGDQLTKQNVDSVCRSLKNEEESNDRLDGLVASVADFHGSMNFIDLVYKKSYNTRSIGDIGTMHQLRSAINRRDVTASALGDKYRPCSVFLADVLDAEIISAALNHFRMDTPQDKAKDHISPAFSSAPEKQRWWDMQLYSIIDKYILNDKTDWTLLDDSPSDASQTDMSNTTTFKCRYPGCSHPAFRLQSQMRNHEKQHGVTISDNSQKDTRESAGDKDVDGVFVYHTSLVKQALLERDFLDSITEGDGDRTCRLWKFKLLHFKAAGRTKYALEALKLQLDLQTLEPSVAHRLKWNRFINTSGGMGKNIALDLNCEHYVRYTKDAIAHEGPNLTFEIAQAFSRTIGEQRELMDRFDQDCGLTPESGKHTDAGREDDIMAMVKILHEQQVFQYTPERPAYMFFPKHTCHPLHTLEPANVKKWILEHKKKTFSASTACRE